MTDVNREDVQLRSRVNDLNNVLQGVTTNSSMQEFLLTTDGLLDALLALYDECSSDKLQFNKCARSFVNKYKSTVKSVRKLRVSASDFDMRTIIGQGHFGEVRVVRERCSGTVYAMKSLRKHETLTQPDIACIEEERDIMAKTTSPWLTKLHYAFQDTNYLYLIMDYHPGGDLLSLLARFDEMFEEDMAKFYVAEIALAINDVHSMGYIHRDVKPENVLLDIAGHIRLADFGSAAKLSWDNKVHAGMKMPVGTPDYISPELLHSINSDSHKKYGPEVDWWSLGVCTYEMLHGKTPFTDENGSIMNTYSNIMNYKDQLQFSDETVSKEAVNFIQKLLTDTDSRIGFEDICGHQFLSHLDLKQIQNSTPPFVPSILGLDDTSNFEEFDPMKPKPSIDDIAPHRGPFSGKDLPFVGFTYTKNNVPLDVDSHVADKTHVCHENVTTASMCTTWNNGQANGLEVKLTVKLQELQTFKDQIHQLELRELAQKSDIENLEQRCKSKDDEMSHIISDSISAEQELTSYKERYQKIADDLSKEVAERKILDERTHKIWSDIQDMSFEARQIEDEINQVDVDTFQEAVVQLEFEKEALNKKLHKTEKQLKLLQVELEKAKSQINESRIKMDKERKKSVDWQKRDIQLLEERERIWEKQSVEQQLKIASLEEKILELESIISTQKQETHHNNCCAIQSSQEKIMEVVNKLDKRRSDERSWKIKERKLNDTIADLEARLELYRNRGLLSRQPETSSHLHDRVSSHQLEVTDQRQTIEELKKTIQKYVDNEREEKESHVSLEKQVQELKGDMKKMNKEKTELETKHGKEREGFEEDLESIKEDNIRLSKELRDLQETHDANVTQQNMDKKALKDLRNEHKKCETLQDENGQKISLLEEEVKTRVMTIKQLEQSLEAEKNVVKERLQKVKRNSSEKISASKICDLQQEKDFLESRVKSLEVKLASKTAIVTESTGNDHKLGKLQEDCDKKVALIKRLQTELSECSDLLEKSEVKIDALHVKESELKDQLSLVEQRLVSSVSEVEDKLSQAQIDKKELEVKLSQVNDQRDLDAKYKDLLMCHKQLETTLSEETREKRKAIMNLESVRGELATRSHQFELEVKKTEKWRIACEELDEQNRDLEIAISTMKQREEQTKSEKAELEKATEDKLDEINETAKQLKHEQMNRNVAIEKMQLLKSKMDNTNALHEREMDSITVQLQHEQGDVEELNKRLVDLENLKAKQEQILETQKKNIQVGRTETIKVKEEISTYITANHKLRKENLELSQKLEEAMDKFELIFGEKVTLETVVDKLQGSHFVEKYRFESTIDQQMKLINYLQTKSEGSVRKKKLFGKDKGLPPIPTLPFGVKDLQASLELEQKRCIKLQGQVERLRRENNKMSHDSLQKKSTMKSFTSLKSITPLKQNFMSNLTHSPTSQPSPLSMLTPRVHPVRKSYKTPTKQRMHHKIPHRFVTGLNTQPTKCGVCLGGITFVKQASKCQECRMVCHPKCAVSALATCGFPTDYVQHLTHMTSKMAADKLRPVDSEGQTIMEGWIKIPRCNKPGWEKKWGRMEGTELLIYHDESSKKHIDMFDLTPGDDTDMFIHSAVTSAEMSNTASTDLPYIMRLERVPHTTCWPQRHLYIMACSFPDKQMWVATFEAAISHSTKQIQQNTSKLQTATLLRLEGEQKLEMNCSLVLDDRLLLGAEEGLYVAPLHTIPTSPTDSSDGVTSVNSCGSVSQMLYIESIDTVIMVIGQDRRIALVDKAAIDRKMSGETSVLPSRLVDDITGCTVFDASEWRGVLYLCVGMATKVSVMVYKPKLRNFSHKQELDICEPCSCVIISDNTAIVGSNKFYRIDLEFPRVVEFIDQNDNSLAFAAFGAAIHNSFPLAVIQTNSAVSHKEFLLCFHEFGVYVTFDGRRSRSGDLKWSGVPLHFTYRDPYLYVTYFSGIQTTYIPLDRRELKSTQKNRKVPCPRFLGHSQHKGVAYFASNNLTSTEIYLVHADQFAVPDSTSSVISLDTADIENIDPEYSPVSLPSSQRGKIRKSDSISIYSDSTPPHSPPKKIST